jgi:glycosyltransferase involved in cell wall biosynthesis
VVISLTDYWWLCHRINLLRPGGTRCDGPTPGGCARCQAEQQRRFRLPAERWPSAVDVLWRAAETLPALGGTLGLPRQAERQEHLRDTLNRAAALIAPSSFLAQTYVRYGVDPARIRVWRQGVELRQCLLRPPSDELRFTFFGQLKRHKGVDLLLSAWGQLRGERPRRLTLYGSAAGEPEYDRQLRDMAAGLDGVIFGGQLKAADVWRALAEADALVMPVRWVENSPNVILEAQAVGVPVVGADLGGVAELVQHERNGLLHRPDNVDDLARQLQRLLDEPGLVGELRSGALPFRHVDDEIDQIVALYAEVAAKPAARPAVSRYVLEPLSSL